MKNNNNNKFKNFKKSDFESNYPFIEKVIIRIDNQDSLKQFKEDVLEDMSKGEFQVFDKIKLVGKDENQQIKVNCKKTKFKKFKALMKDADTTKLDHVDIIMVDGIAQELDDDDAVIIAKMIKRLCKKYDALVKCKSL